MKWSTGWPFNEYEAKVEETRKAVLAGLKARLLIIWSCGR